MFKSLLNALHDIIHQAVHIALILPVAGLKATVSFLTHVHDELKKV